MDGNAERWMAQEISRYFLNNLAPGMNEAKEYDTI
jgi:hypothetical protein